MRVDRCGCLSLVTSLVVLAAGACAKTRPYQKTFDIPVLAPSDAGEVLKGGMRIRLAPVTRENAFQFPQIVRSVRWVEPELGPAYIIGAKNPGGPVGEPRPRSGTVSLIPLPAFFLSVDNHTGASVNLSSVAIEVENNAHHPFSAILSSEVLRQRFFGDVTGANPFVAGDKTLMDQMMDEIGKLSVFSPSLSIADGKAWEGFLVLDVNAQSSHEYYDLMKSLKGFVVHLKGVPTANGPSEFDFQIDKSVRPTVLTCPPEILDPTPEQCGTGQAAPSKG
jgi:hypothetical protein